MSKAIDQLNKKLEKEKSLIRKSNMMQEVFCLISENPNISALFYANK
jgi:hypothetical protein